MKAKYWYYKGSDKIGTGNEEQDVKELRGKKRKKVVEAGVCGALNAKTQTMKTLLEVDSNGG